MNICELLFDPDKYVRRDAVESLIKISDVHLPLSRYELHCQAANDPEPIVRARVIENIFLLDIYLTTGSSFEVLIQRPPGADLPYTDFTMSRLSNITNIDPPNESVQKYRELLDKFKTDPNETVKSYALGDPQYPNPYTTSTTLDSLTLLITGGNIPLSQRTIYDEISFDMESSIRHEIDRQVIQSISQTTLTLSREPQKSPRCQRAHDHVLQRHMFPRIKTRK